MKEFESLAGHTYAAGHQPTFWDRLRDHILATDISSVTVFVVGFLGLVVVISIAATIANRRRLYAHRTVSAEAREAREEARREEVARLRRQRTSPSQVSTGHG